MYGITPEIHCCAHFGHGLDGNYTLECEVGQVCLCIHDISGLSYM